MPLTITRVLENDYSNSFNLILENLKQSAVFKQFKEDTIGEGVTNQDGKITFKYTNGSQYTGLWKDGKPHGKGIYTWADGNTYDGEWNDGKFDGKGTMTYKKGSTYNCVWKKEDLSQNLQ